MRPAFHDDAVDPDLKGAALHDLFERFAHRYDLHTPPDHYKHDHRFVLGEAERAAPGGRLLDVGCGTGAFAEKAVAAGFDVVAADSAPGMVDVAAARLGKDRVRLERMQDLTDRAAFDVVCALSWSIHYVESDAELVDVVRRCAAALRPRGILLLQVANSPRMSGAVRVDREPGPSGEPDDTLFIHRFVVSGGDEVRVQAEYVYASQAFGELMTERHVLRFCDPRIIADTMRAVGLVNVVVVDPTSVSPFVMGTRPDGD